MTEIIKADALRLLKAIVILLDRLKTKKNANEVQEIENLVSHVISLIDEL